MTTTEPAFPAAPAKRRASPLLAAAFIGVAVASGCAAGSEGTNTRASTTTRSAAPTAPATAVAPALPVPPFSVVREASTRRDGRPSFYVVIDPVDLGADAFKQTVKGAIQGLAADNGPDFSARIFDNEATALQTFDKDTGSGAADDPQRAQHFIATYSGGLSTALYPYELSWFPATFTDNPTVGQWVGTEEWKPGTSAPAVPAPTSAAEAEPWKSIPNDGTHKMGGVGGKNWGVWESAGARADDGCEWSVRMIDPQGPATILDEGTAGKGERATVAINPVGDANLVFVTSGCQPWTAA